MAWLPTAAQTSDEALNLHVYPYLQWATPTSMIIKWETRSPAIGTVRYGEDSSLSNTQSETEAVTLHEIRLTGLQPATRYPYQVTYGEVSLPPATFTTAPAPGTPTWRMVAYGDNRTHPEVHEKIARQILQLNPSMIIHSGDLVTQGAKYEQWKEQYFDPMRGLAENIAVFPSLGNHEQNSQHYYDYMSLPDENGESFYSFDYGNAHFLALNSNAGEAPFDLDSAQTQWIIRDLEAHKDAQWKIVFFHHPLFRCHPTRGIEPQRWVWQEVFEAHGVDLVVNGHDHYYQRTYAIGNYQGKPSRGLYHLISGGGGAPNYPIVPKVHAASRRSVHHFTVMDFLDDRIIGRAIDAEGNVFDAFIYDKEAENAPEEFISYEIFEIERDLTAAIHQLPVIAQDQARGMISATITLENPFQHPLNMTFGWEPSANWEGGPPQEIFLQPGQALNLPMQIRAVADNLYPLPAASLHFLRPDGELAFKNDRIVFYPVKIGDQRTVSVPELPKAPRIDGAVDAEEWAASEAVTGFLDMQNGETPLQGVSLQLARRKNKLFLSGTIQASEAMATSGDTIRDGRYLLRRENVQVHIAVGETVYTFAVNPKGALYDAKAGKDDWDSKVVAAASLTAGGWQFEMAIPLKELEMGDQPLRINFMRIDQENSLTAEYSRTFGISPLDHRIPMYQSDSKAVDRFARLEWK